MDRNHPSERYPPQVEDAMKKWRRLFFWLRLTPKLRELVEDSELRITEAVMRRHLAGVSKQELMSYARNESLLLILNVGIEILLAVVTLLPKLFLNFLR